MVTGSKTDPVPTAALTVAAVLHWGLEDYARTHRLPAHHWKVLNAILNCRTAVLGGQRYHCAHCGRDHWVYHSCRNRHCPTCQGANARDWLEKQEQALLPIPYFHLVFTLPHLLNPLIGQNQRALYNLLFASASATLLEFGRNNLGAQLGITAVLHTWSQTLLDHYHLHCIVSGGGLALDGSHWKRASGKYLFAVQALSEVYRAKFRDGLQKLFAAGKLTLEGQCLGLQHKKDFDQLLQQALAKPWVVYSKRPFAGPRQVLAYLSRYTHRVGISNRRLLQLDEIHGTVRFSWKDYAQGSRRKILRLAVPEFIRRFCLHVLPPKFVKIRHFGFLSHRQRAAKVAQARHWLSQHAEASPSVEAEAPSQRPASEPARRCPFCGQPGLELVESCASSLPKSAVPCDSS